MKSIIAVSVETNFALARARGVCLDNFKEFMAGYCFSGKERSLIHKEYRRWYMKTYHQAIYPQRSKQVKLTFSLEEYRTLTFRAKKSGKKPAVFAKNMVFSAMTKSFVPPDEKQAKALEVQIRKIGNNINQVATAVNSGKGFGKFKFNYLEKQLLELDRKIDEAFRKPEDLVVFVAKEINRNPALIPQLRAMLDKAETHFKKIKP